MVHQDIIIKKTQPSYEPRTAVSLENKKKSIKFILLQFSQTQFSERENFTSGFLHKVLLLLPLLKWNF